jgi:molybdopterin-containing oxidoreductase family iron-sulfur binding subunit
MSRGHGHDHGYWRSLGELSGTSAFTPDEFPENAQHDPPTLSRRDMLTLLGASISLASLAGCRKPVEEIVPFVESPENMLPGVAKRYATTMPLGLDAYGLVVESHDGRPTKIEGNELHPATLGASSAWIQASVLGLYDPDRSQSIRAGNEKKAWSDFVAAWKAIETEQLAAGGAGLAVLSESFASPTLARLANAFLERFPNASWLTYEPLGDEPILSGIEAATGRALRPMLHLEQAEVVLALDADFLGVDSDVVRNTRGFAAARAPERGSMNRLWVVEAHHSLTGANADHRLRLASRRVPGLVAALEAAVQGAHPASMSDVPAEWLEALVSDLLEHRGRSLVVAGRRQAPEVHAAVLAINAALGNVGTTVTYREPLDARMPESAKKLGALVEAMRAGQVRTLVILGANPVYNAPADLDFGGALGQVTHKIHLGAYIDETGARADWHVPQAHYLEAWGDARAIDGTLSVVQPLIAPLYDGKSPVELLGLLATGEEKAGHERVRETWLAILGESGFEKRFKRVLHDGLLEGSTLPPVTPTVAASARALESAGVPGAQELEVELLVSPTLFDGRFANISWLQEMPDPLTKLTWDNAALVSPATAAELGVEMGDVVRLSVGERSITIPAHVLPGMAEHCVGVYLGHGRRFGGRIADASGFDAYPLRTSDAPYAIGGARIEPTGDTYLLVETQEHGTMTEPNVAPWQKGKPERKRDLIRETSFEEYEKNPEFAKSHHEPARSMFPERTYTEGHQWGMTIDLNTCVGCNACIVACQSENNVPVVGKEQVYRGREMHWLRVDRYFEGSPDEPRVAFQAIPCMHCETAPCEQVCPVGATTHDAQGLNVMVYNRCIGTRYCSNNCPYKVRRFNYYNFTKDTPESLQMAFNPDVTVRSRGVMEKCTYCVQRIHRAEIQAKLDGRELVDGDVTTACQQACPAGAIRFGDLRDPASRVNETKRDPRNYALLEELNTKPRTTFLAKLRNPHPRLATHEEGAPEEAGHHG